MMDAVLYSLIQTQGWKKDPFTTSGIFTAKITGVHFIRGTGGGGGGHSTGGGGSSGAACDMVPVYLLNGESVVLDIGAGGAIGGTGGTTSFGSYISLPGGKAGPSNTANAISVGGLRTFYAGSTMTGAVSPDAISIGPFITGASVFVPASGVYLYGNSRYPAAAGHAAGYFGSSGDNSGAGGNQNTVGYSGYLEVLWQE